MPTPLISGAFSRTGLYEEYPELANCTEDELRASLAALAHKKRNEMEIEKNQGTGVSAKTWLTQNHEKIEQKEHEQSEPDAEKGGTPRSSRKSESGSIEETDMKNFKKRMSKLRGSRMSRRRGLRCWSCSTRTLDGAVCVDPYVKMKPVF